MRLLLATLSLLFLSAQIVNAGVIKGTINGGKRLRKSPAVVYLTGVREDFKISSMHPTMDQRNMTFIPHVLPIQVGTTVDFLNNDEVRHNVFSPDNEKYNLGTWPTDSIKQYVFATKGVYSQRCNVHPEMEAFIVVLDTPYFATTAKDGSFELADVTPGNYTVKVWHERLRFKKQNITVPDSGEVQVDFTADRKR